jgi:hypothetical protein
VNALETASTDGAPPSIAAMVLSSRPWRLVRDLSKVLAATLATAAFLVITSSVPPLADQLGPVRMAVLMVLAVGLLAVWLVVAHGLWERRSGEADRARVRRVNAATVLTLSVGLLFGYLVLFAAVLLASALTLTGTYLESNIGHPVGIEEYLELTWLVCSLATVAGAIGSGFETDDDIRDVIRHLRRRPEDRNET